MDREWNVVVIGGGGLQAQGLYEGAERGGHIDRWLAVDRSWLTERETATAKFGVSTRTADVLDDPDALRELAGSTRLMVNLAGPFYRTGGVILDACIETGTDYMDICDDADATLSLLERDEAARAAGVHALLGMGASPGTTNIMVRTAIDVLGSAAHADVCWSVDIHDMTLTQLWHFWHGFSLVAPDGTTSPIPTWEELSIKTADFLEPVGPRELIEMAHPEPVTLPRFLPIESVANYGSMVPGDPQYVAWALARLGAVSGDDVTVDGREIPVGDAAIALWERYRANAVDGPYLGGGFLVEVHTDGDGYCFVSGADDITTEESTGGPAAAGIGMLLAGEVPGPGVFPPECLEPRLAWPALARIGRGRGVIALYRLEGGRRTERLSIRQLVEAGSGQAATG
jgi:saccharopine dehydrogenase (NAD+, L-lysine-forming)